jgi:predicted CoA-binding protein
MSHYEAPSDQVIKELLTNASTIAIVGASSKPDRASYGIMQRLQRVGYRVIPVNPHEREVLGERAYASLSEIHEPIDIVDVFRRAEFTPPIADEAVKIGAKALWLQSGIVNEEAAARANAGGLLVVMDMCLATMHSILKVSREATALRSPLRAG